MSAQRLFVDNGVRVITGARENDPEKAVLSQLNGSLATGDNVCDH
jgi:hypothetical protein